MTPENGTTDALARRIGQHSAIYGVGVVLTVLAGLITLAVFTRLMAPSEFGAMVVLLVLAGGLRRVYTLAVVQGTIALVFGGGEDDSDDDLTEDVEPVSNKRELLGTGLILAVALAGSGTVVMWLLAPDVSSLLFGSAGRADGVRLAAVAAALDGVGHLLMMVPRFERRPQAYVVLNIVGPLIAFAVGVPLVASGDGAEGGLFGFVVGSATSLVLLLGLLRSRFRLSFSFGRAVRIVKVGAVIVPLILALYVISHGGIVVLSRSSSVPPVEVGLYAVALMFGSVILRLNSVFFMAWLPMKRSSLFMAVHQERGHGWIYSTLTTYLLLGLCAVLVVLTAAAGALIQIVGPEYSDAERLIVLLGLAGLGQSVFVLSYRMTSFPRKRLALALTATAAAIVFVTGATVLVRTMGVDGVPLAAVGSFVCATLVMLGLNQRGPNKIPFQYRRLAGIAIATSLCLTGHTLLTDVAGGLGALVDVGTVVVFALLVFAMRLVSRQGLAVMVATLRDVMGRRSRRDPSLVAALGELTPAHARTLDRAAGPAHAGADEPLPPPDELVRALRAACDIGEPSSHDGAIGRYLLSELPRAERDGMARALWREDVSPAELDAFEQAFETLRKLPASSWPALARPPAARVKRGVEPPPVPLSVACDLPARDHDLMRLLDAYATTSAGDRGGQVVFLAGEAGSGRTALLRALASGLEDVDPRPVVIGGGFRDGRYASWEQSDGRRPVFTGSLAGAVAPLEGLAPFSGLVTQALAKRDRPLDLAGEAVRLDPPRFVARVLADLAKQAPVVCLVDDAEDAPGRLWGDVLLELAENVVPDLPLLLVLAIDRPAQLDEHEDDEPDSLYVARRLTGRGLARWHPLDPVGIEDLEHWTGPAAPEVLHLLLALVVGRAAWAARLWTHWRAEGVVVMHKGADAGWRFGLNGRVRATNPVDDVLGQRLRERVGGGKVAVDRERTLLAYAALEGRVFTADAVSLALDRDQDEVVDLFDDTLATSGEPPDGFVCETDLVLLDDESGRRHLLRYRFEAELDWLTLYDRGLKDSRRRAAAAALAQALVATYDGRVQRVARVLTGLFETAHDPHSAARFRRIHDAGASRAVTLWHAYAILDEPDPTERFARRRKSQILLAGAIELLSASASHDGLRLAQAAHRLAPLRFDQAEALYLAGTHHLKTGDIAQARDSLTAAVNLRQKIADRKGEADARAVLAIMDARDGQSDRARDELGAVLAIYRELGDRHGEAEILFRLAKLDNAQGHPGEARRELSGVLDLLRKLGDRRAEADLLRRIATIDVESGASEEARRGFILAANLYREVGNRAGEADARHSLARLDLDQGADEHARAELRRALDLYLELEDQHSEAATRYGLASINIDEGASDNARDELWRVVDLGYDLQDDDVVTAALEALEAMDQAQSS